MYEKRLLKFLKTYNGVFTAREIAGIWKRSADDVTLAALELRDKGKIKLSSTGWISLKGKHAT
jgi:hypothetical protein